MIKQLINETRINPTGLDWRRFIIAEVGTEFAGCGQLKPHPDGTLELASIATVPALRGQGVASRIIQKLTDSAPRPVYLTCRGQLGDFYKRFGFRIVEYDELQGYFRRISRLAGFFTRTHIFSEPLLVMRLD